MRESMDSTKKKWNPHIKKPFLVESTKKNGIHKKKMESTHKKTVLGGIHKKKMESTKNGIHTCTPWRGVTH